MDWFRFLRAVLSETWYSFPKNLLNNVRMLGPLGAGAFVRAMLQSRVMRSTGTKIASNRHATDRL